MPTIKSVFPREGGGSLNEVERWKEPGVQIRICIMICLRIILGLQEDKANQKSFITRSPSVTFGDSFLPEEAF